MPEPRLPNYIRTHRKRAHLTQGEVAFLLGTKSIAGVCRHELFQQSPSLETLLAYEMLFSTPVRSLYCETTDTVETKLRERIQILVEKLKKTKPNRITGRKLAFLNALLNEEGRCASV
jgi:transcriptional regulator with XRE-family HTH domain